MTYTKNITVICPINSIDSADGIIDGINQHLGGNNVFNINHLWVDGDGAEYCVMTFAARDDYSQQSVGDVRVYERDISSPHLDLLNELGITQKEEL